MFSNKLAEFTMRGLPQAALAATGFTVGAKILPPIGLLSGAVIALYTLRAGARSGALLVLLTSVVLALLAMLGGLTPLQGFLAGAISWVPIVAMAYVLRESGSWTVTLQATLAASVLLIVVVYLVNPDIAEIWRAVLDKNLKPFLQSGLSNSTVDLDRMLDSLATWFTGILVTLFLINNLITLLIGRYWQSLRYNPDGFALEFRELRAGLWPAVAALVFGVLAATTDWPAVTGLALAAGSLFLFQGLAVIHAVVANRNWHVAVLVVMYFSLLLFNWPALLTVVGLGLADTFANFRDKFPRSAA